MLKGNSPWPVTVIVAGTGCFRLEKTHSVVMGVAMGVPRLQTLLWLPSFKYTCKRECYWQGWDCNAGWWFWKVIFSCSMGAIRGQTENLIVLGLGRGVIWDRFHFQSIRSIMLFCFPWDSPSSVSLWMTCPLCHLPAALCDIERYLYRNLCCKSLEDTQNIWVYGCSGWDGAMQQWPRPRTGEICGRGRRRQRVRARERT